MLKRILLTCGMIVVLTPAVYLLALTLNLYFAVVNAGDPRIVVSASAVPEWRTQYPFSEDPFAPLPTGAAYPNLLRVGEAADAALSRYHGDWVAIMHTADWAGLGRLTLPDGTQPLVWRYAMEGAVIDIDAVTGDTVLLVDGGTYGDTKDLCKMRPGDFVSHATDRCIAQNIFQDFPPYVLLGLYLVVVGLIFLRLIFLGARNRGAKGPSQGTISPQDPSSQ